MEKVQIDSCTLTELADTIRAVVGEEISKLTEAKTVRTVPNYLTRKEVAGMFKISLVTLSH